MEDKQRSFLFISSSESKKNVGRFLKNVGDFSKNVGVFFQNVGSFWGLLRHFLLIFPRCGNVCGSVVAQEMERCDWLKA